MGQRTGALVTQVALQHAMWGGITPGCWRHFIPCTAIALSYLSPCMSPHPWGWYHTHQDMALSFYSLGPGCRGRRVGTGSVGTGWAQCGTGTARRQRGHAGGRAVAAVWGGGILWAWHGLGWCRDGDRDKHGVGKVIGMMGWHRGRDDVGLGMVRRLGWHGDGLVTKRTWHGHGTGWAWEWGRKCHGHEKGIGTDRDDGGMEWTKARG